MSKIRTGLLTSAAFVAIFSAGVPAFAQDQIEEVVVTAMKRAEPLHEVPLSVTAVDQKTIDTLHINDPASLVRAAPSLQVESNNASSVASFFAIRGIGTLAFVKTIEQSVGVDLDGVSLVRPETGVLAFYDLDDVEVLNGPQGMLFGKNASAGLISIRTKAPELGVFDGYVDAEYGNMSTPSAGNEYQVQGVVNIPVTDDSALRITGVFSHNDPLVKDVFTTKNENYGHTQGGGRVKYLWQPTSNLSITIAGDMTNMYGAGVGETTDRVVVPGGPDATLDTLAGVKPGPENVENSSNAKTNDHIVTGGVQANVVYTFPSGSSLTSISAYRGYHEAGFVDNDMHQVNIQDVNSGLFNFAQYSEELRYASPVGDALDYQFGLYYITARGYESAQASGNAGGPAPPPPFTTLLGADGSDTEHTTSAAVFGQATYHFTDQFRLVAGARYTHDNVNNSAILLATPAVIQALGVGVVAQKTARHDNISWRGSLQYDFTPDIMGYVTVAQGYKGPGFNQFSNASVAPETSHQYEVGAKTEFFDKRVSLNLAAYSEVFDNFQDQTSFPNPPFFEVLSAGRLDSRGFEAQVDAIVTEGLTVTGSLAYVDATFGSFIGDQCYAGERAATAIGEHNACFAGPTSNTSNSTGNTLANAPRWAGNISVDYTHSIGDTFQGDLNLSMYSRSGVNYASNNNPATKEPGYSLFGADLGVGPQDGNWKVSVFCRNCFDKRYATFIEPYPLVSTDYGQQFGIDSFRTIGVNLRKTF